MSIWFFLNVIFAWLMLVWARKDFENGNTVMGWISILLSAWNAATAATYIF